MRLTIIPDDNAVYVDGKVRFIAGVRNLLPDQWRDEVRAIQWDGSQGHVEHNSMKNTPLVDISALSSVIDAWSNAAPKIIEPTLDEIRATLKNRVDSDAEAVRMRYLTPGTGMSMTYAEKRDQANAVHSMGIKPDGSFDAAYGESRANALSAQEQVAQFPTLAASVGLEAPTLWDCALLVIAKSEAWATLSHVIEITRLRGKKAISDASDAATARAAYEAITWP